MQRTLLFVMSLLVSTALCIPRDAAAYNDSGVGLGVAVGAAYSPTTTNITLQGAANALRVAAGQSFAWGFFVDIPLLETFYISPAAVLYQYDLGQGHVPMTDIDLNFKFIIPISALHLGAGLTFGLSATGTNYGMHVGALGYASINVVANIDAFLLVNYKKIIRNPNNLDSINAFVGGMFHF